MIGPAVLWCDECDHAFRGEIDEDHATLRRRAQSEEGWSRADDRDLCDTCEFDRKKVSGLVTSIPAKEE